MEEFLRPSSTERQRAILTDYCYLIPLISGSQQNGRSFRLLNPLEMCHAFFFNQIPKANRHPVKIIAFSCLSPYYDTLLKTGWALPSVKRSRAGSSSHWNRQLTRTVGAAKREELHFYRLEDRTALRYDWTRAFTTHDMLPFPVRRAAASNCSLVCFWKFAPISMFTWPERLKSNKHLCQDNSRSIRFKTWWV